EDVTTWVIRPACIDAATLQQLDEALPGRAHPGFLLAASKKQELEVVFPCRRVCEQLPPRRLRLDGIGRRLRAQRAEPAAVRQDRAKALGVGEADLDALEPAHREAADRAMCGIGEHAVSPL